MKNTNYAILNSNTNEFEYAADIIIVGNRKITNPSKEHYLRAGYKEIVYTEQPQEEGFYFTSKIVNKNGIPTQEWERKEIKEIEDE